MKLKVLNRNHILRAASIIDEQGIPKDMIWNQYYVLVNGKEYPFKHLIREAYRLVTGEHLSFQSNESYRGYVEKQLDFVLRYYKEGNNYYDLEKLKLIESKIARITWNTKGWVKPSGVKGKSKNPSFEREYGFGHEEWLFDGDKVIDGYKYGFLEPIHKHRSKYEGKLFNLALYTRDSETNISFWVGNLKDVEVLMPEESKKVLAHYKNKGWYDEMKADLKDYKLNSNQLDQWVKDGAHEMFNIKFKASQINAIYDKPIPILDDSFIQSNRYTLMNISQVVQETLVNIEKSRFSFDESGTEDADLCQQSKRAFRVREIELEMKHNNLQIKFLKYLQKEYGKSLVKRECTAHGASRIDITRKTETGFVFYEIKTYNSLKTSIREGIGQLLEYSLFPTVKEAERIVLVSHVKPSKEIVNYLNHVKDYIRLPFSYIHFDIDQEKIISEI